MRAENYDFERHCLTELYTSLPDSAKGNFKIRTYESGGRAFPHAYFHLSFLLQRQGYSLNGEQPRFPRMA